MKDQPSEAEALLDSQISDGWDLMVETFTLLDGFMEGVGAGQEVFGLMQTIHEGLTPDQFTHVMVAFSTLTSILLEGEGYSTAEERTAKVAEYRDVVMV